MEDNFSVSLAELKQYILSKKKAKIILLTIMVLLSVIYVLTSPKEYVASSKLIIEAGDQADFSFGSGIRNLASFSGNNQNEKQFNVDLYEEVLKSYEFNKKLIQIGVSYEKENMTLENYLNDKLEVNAIVSSFSSIKSIASFMSTSRNVNERENVDSTLKKISASHRGAMSKLHQRLTITVDNEAGLVELSCKMQNAELAAIIVKETEKELIEYVQNYEKKYEEKKLIFLKSQLEVKKRKYEEALTRYSEHLDKNHGLVKQKGDLELTRLINEMNSFYNLYTDLSRQYEQAKIKLAEEKTIFTELQGVTIPSSPITMGIIKSFIVFNILGLVMLVVFITGLFIVKKSLF